MKKSDKILAKAIAKYTAVFLLVMAISYGMTALLFYGICKCFGLGVWSWKTSLGVWLVFLLFSGGRVVLEDKHRV